MSETEKKIKRKIIRNVFLIAIIIEVVVSPLRGYVNTQSASVAAFVIFFAYITFILTKNGQKVKPVNLLIAALLGASVLQLPMRIINFESTLGTLLDFLFHLLAICMAYCFYKSKKTIRLIIIAVSVAMCVFIYFKGYPMWRHNLNYGTFLGNVEKTYIDNIEFQTSEGDTLLLSSFKGKYLVLDCWYTYCGVCYEEFPEVQAFYDTYKDNSDVIFYALHSRMENEETTEKGSQILKERAYTFPCLSIDINNTVLKELGVRVYPTVIIFDRESNLIFRGGIENVTRFVEKKITSGS